MWAAMRWDNVLRGLTMPREPTPFMELGHHGPKARDHRIDIRVVDSLTPEEWFDVLRETVREFGFDLADSAGSADIA